LFVATHNPGKLAELAALLAELPIELVTPADLGLAFEVEEDGQTLLENARAKAQSGVRLSHLPALGEDTGLEVQALGGRPGVRSARFAGPGATSADLCRALLEALGPLKDTRPPAHFRCVAVLMLRDGRAFEGEGILEGTIASTPKGKGGFGYDPIFVLPDGRHLAELSIEEKNLLSHRARAMAALEVRGAFDAVITGPA
jgi:XTP/dITP diphosphohydrolase